LFSHARFRPNPRRKRGKLAAGGDRAARMTMSTRRCARVLELCIAVCVAAACGGKSRDDVAGTSAGGSRASGGAAGEDSLAAGTNGLGGAPGAGASPATGATSFGGSEDLGGTPGSGDGETAAGTDSRPAGSGDESGAGANSSEGGAPSHAEAGTSTDGGAGAGTTANPVCGDGSVDASEACDDGNLDAGDGCDDGCHVEAGFVCSSVSCDADGCALHVPVTFRDFDAHTEVDGHPDFQPGYVGNGAIQGLVEPELDQEGKPVLSSTASVANGFLHGAQAFAEWYRDGARSGGPIAGDLVLWDDGSGRGRYVNRWGAHGERWRGSSTAIDYGTPLYGGPAGGGCDACTPTGTQICYDPCIPWGSSIDASCCAEAPADPDYDGTPLFFPVDSGPDLLSEPRTEASIPEQYGWVGFPPESTVASTLGVTTPEPTAWAPFPSATHNFSFTTEVEYWFRYDASRTYTFEIGGDDDIWLFLNGHLAVDLGSFHVPLSGSATLAGGRLSVTAMLSSGSDGIATTVTSELDAETLGLESGHVYPLAIFSAEREVSGSTFELALEGIDGARSTCAPAP
jgi:fibro-slime domain-containing protein